MLSSHMNYSAFQIETFTFEVCNLPATKLPHSFLKFPQSPYTTNFPYTYPDDCCESECRLVMTKGLGTPFGAGATTTVFDLEI